MAEEAPQVSYEQLALIEHEFDEIDSEIMRKQYELSKGAYAKRAEAVAKIPSFWALVLEQAPMEVDQYIQPTDSQIFAESLVSLNVSRPELDAGKSNGSSRSLKIRFEFKPNDHFEESVLEKEFSHRRSSDGWQGLVSEPVKITWKKGKDVTEGLTDGALALWEARKKKGDMEATDSKEYTELKKKVEHWNGANTSFFTWFGYVSGRRWVSAEESEAANKEYTEKLQAKKNGTAKAEESEKEDDEEEDDQEDDSEVEVHEAGEDLAISFAEDIWPNAIKFFTQAQESDDLSELDFESDDEMDEDDAEGGDDEPVDIRALVQKDGKGRKRQSDVGPASKKQKK
ncbi:Putative nucleosome assembly protein [Fulvia fulva]|nr:Putative nucleosome assembly protein [Fulvia fulva]